MKPSHFSLDFAIRPNVLGTPIFETSLSDDSKPRPRVLLDANENSIGSCIPDANDHGCSAGDVSDAIADLHRYPSPTQSTLKRAIAKWRGLSESTGVCLGVGAADIIDLLIRTCCIPSKDAILVAPPTFALYRARAMINDVGVVECLLELSDDGFELRVNHLFDVLAQNQNVKIIFLDSPGNPNGTLIPLHVVKSILDHTSFHGILVVDEAYIDFCNSPDLVTAVPLLESYSNLIVAQTFSKSHGMAGLRLGMAFAHLNIASQLNKVVNPFNIPALTSTLALLALSPSGTEIRRRHVDQVRSNRQMFIEALSQSRLRDLGVGKLLGGNDGNFVLFPIMTRSTQEALGNRRDDDRAQKVCVALRDIHSIAVRYLGNAKGCEACLRITVGNEEENKLLLDGLSSVLMEY